MYFSLFKGTEELLPGVILVTHRLAILGELHVLAQKGSIECTACLGGLGAAS